MEIMTGILFSAYPLIKFAGGGEAGSYQAFLYCLFSLVMMLILMIQSFTGKRKIRKPENKLDYAMIILFVFSLGSLFYKMLTVQVNIEYEMIVLAMVFSYYVFSCRNDFPRVFTDIFLAIGALIYVLLYLFYFFGETVGWINVIVKDETLWSAWIILTVMLGMICYCKGKGYRGRSIFGLVMSLAGFLLLLLYQDVIWIYLMGALILLIPAINWPNRGIIKRSIQLLFLWVMMFCNMRILMEMAGMEVRIELYSIGCCAFIEILAVIGGILLLFVRDNIPEGGEERSNWTCRMWKTIVRMLTAYVVGVLVLVTGVIQNGSSSEKRWIDFSKLSQELSESLKGTQNVFQMFYDSWGLAGVIFIFLTLFILVEHLYGRYWECEENSMLRKKILYLMPVIPLFILQLLFAKLDVGVLPVYIWAITSILYDRVETVTVNQSEQ